ncbi:MAG: hypothetical protein ACYTAS_01080 [Planctomycetota bacterium]|jgi:hypothetical protein
MRFLALLRKELRESLPWLLLAGLLLLAVGILALRAHVPSSGARYWQYHRGMAPGETLDTWRLLSPAKLDLPALWLSFIAPGLGLVLGVRHFWVPLFTRTWAFLLHRSVARLTILWAKLAAAVLAFVLSLGIIWTGLYWYACRPGLFPVPEPVYVLVNGWLYILMGMVVYLGTALSALSTARWYTSRIFGLAFALLATLIILHQPHPIRIVVMTALVVAILLAQTTSAFLNREF